MPDRNLELEAEIAKSPDEVAPYLVYADWLQQHGDPRGELIALAVELETSPANAALAPRLAELHASHDAAWLGLAALPVGVSLGWRRGFVDSIQVGDDDAAKIDMAATYTTVWTALRDKPVAALVRRLKLGAFDDDVDYQPSWAGVTAAMVQHGVPARLRALEYHRGGYWDISNTSVDGLEALYPQLATLEKLYIQLGHMELGAIDLPSLRDFEVHTGGFTSENMQSVVAAKWPKLERLWLTFGDSEDYGASTTVDDVLPLITASNLPHVTDLALANAPFTDELLPALATSPLLARLTRLALDRGLLGDVGAQVLIDHAEAFKHLVAIDVSQSFITREVGARLVAALPNVVGATAQQDGEYRYCQIGE